MGSDWTIKLAGKTFNPEELSSLILRSLKNDADAFFKRAVTKAVITVPAYYNDRQRKATMAAGKIAGLDVQRIVNEPTSAAIAYGFHEANEDKTLLIFDLGGGTFDVSIVEFFEGTLEVKASAGESFLGGEDFTRSLAGRILERRKINYERAEVESPLLVSRLIQQCELAKCRLSTQETATVRVPDRRGELTEGAESETITRAEMEAWVSPILNRIELPIRRVLSDARLSREKIDEVILVGGAMRMPLVVQRVTELLGKPPQRRLNPDEVVALGAAVQAGLVESAESVKDLVVTDVAPFTLGVEITKSLGHEMRDGYFLPVIERNTTIPVSRVQRVATLAPNQPTVKIRVYQGEARRVEDNLCLGEFEVTGVPLGPAGQAVDIRFSYDLNGVLEVEATIVATNKKIHHVITRHARNLTPEQIRRAVRDMEKMKVHPREEEANRFLLLRAERLYQELGRFERENLSELLDAFEGAWRRKKRRPLKAADRASKYFSTCTTRALMERATMSQPSEWKSWPAYGAQLLDLPADATPADGRAAFLQRLPKADFVPAEPLGAGLGLLDNRLTTTPFADATEEVRRNAFNEQLNEFSRDFWNLPPPERHERWEKLKAYATGPLDEKTPKCVWLPSALKHLDYLSAGIYIDDAAGNELTGKTAKLAEAIKEMFPLPLLARIKRRQEWLQVTDAQPSMWTLAVARLEEAAPAIAHLDPALLIEMRRRAAECEDPPKFIPRPFRPHRNADLNVKGQRKTKAETKGSWTAAYVIIFIAIGVLRGMLGSNDKPERSTNPSPIKLQELKPYQIPSPQFAPPKSFELPKEYYQILKDADERRKPLQPPNEHVQPRYFDLK